MKRNSIAIAALAALFGASAASAEVVAGWDFSQYAASGSLGIDATFANTYAVDAQYSDLDLLRNPQPGMGAGGTAYNNQTGSGDFGRMYHDGSFGSSNTSPGLNFRADTGSLLSNQDAPVFGLEMSQVGSANTLQAEGQVFGNDLKMRATSSVDVVFEADRSGAGVPGFDWQFSFAGQSSTGGNISVSVESSEDGVGYTSHGTVTLTPSEARFAVPIGTNSGNTEFVRLGLVSGALIDNVAVEVIPGAAVPIPAWILGPLAGGVLWVSRRRLQLVA